MPEQPPPPTYECWRIRVTCRVQGVSFRAYAKREALRLGLTGTVSNQPDGSVEIIAEGDKPALSAFRAWCEVGSPHAKVSAVEVTPAPVSGRHHFTISR
ncbi:MAG: acylphosphatase [Thermomicrobiales bacterium]